MTHMPVMLPEVLEALAAQRGGTYLDATFGGGGYAGAILAAADCTLWAIDRDPDAITRGAALASRFPGRLHLLQGSSGIDPATRSFQALRIRVNDELGQVERALAQAAALLGRGGRLVVVSFHSGEDRLVKRFMTGAAGRLPAPSRHDPGGLAGRPDAGFRLLFNRARRPSDAEVACNPRARSARLRALERLTEPTP